MSLKPYRKESLRDKHEKTLTNDELKEEIKKVKLGKVESKPKKKKQCTRI